MIERWWCLDDPQGPMMKMMLNGRCDRNDYNPNTNNNVMIVGIGFLTTPFFTWILTTTNIISIIIFYNGNSQKWPDNLSIHLGCVTSAIQVFFFRFAIDDDETISFVFLPFHCIETVFFDWFFSCKSILFDFFFHPMMMMVVSVLRAICLGKKISRLGSFHFFHAYDYVWRFDYIAAHQFEYRYLFFVCSSNP